MITLVEFVNAVPLVIIASAAILTLLITAFFRKSTNVVFAITIISLFTAIFFYFGDLEKDAIIFSESLRINMISVMFSVIALSAVLISTLSAKSYIEKLEINFGEYYSLSLFSALGMIVMIHSANLIVLFIGLELMSICFYILTGFLRKRVKSNEGALKYFLLGAFMTGFLLFGISLIYGTAGTLDFVKLLQNQSLVKQPLFLIGAALFSIGFFFKMGIFPFHMWVPDVYEGAPTSVTGLMSTAGKIAAVGTLSPFIINSNITSLKIVFSVLAVLTMLFGNVIALSQVNIKRLLAFSSIASAGYILVGITAMNEFSVKGVSFYLMAYTFMQLGAFVLVSIIEKPSEGINDYRGVNLDDYKGLSKRNPALAVLLTIFLFSLGGIPPFAGFWGKYYLFYAAIKSELIWLSVVAILLSVISIYYYLKIIVYMWFSNEQVIENEITIPSFTSIALYISAGLTLIFGLFPGLFFLMFKTVLK